MAACIKTIKCCPSPTTTIICRCVGWNLARNYHFLNHFTLLTLFVSFFLFLHFVFQLFKGLGAPRMFFFSLLFSLLLFFIVIQQHFFVRANAFWTASFLPFQARCHCCCLWAGCIYLGVIGVWMSEVMRCIHTWLLPSLRGLRQTQPSWAPAWEVPHCCLLNTSQNGSFILRWTNTITGADTSMMRLWFEELCVCISLCVCVHAFVGGEWKQCLVVC